MHVKMCCDSSYLSPSGSTNNIFMSLLMLEFIRLLVSFWMAHAILNIWCTTRFVRLIMFRSSFCHFVTVSFIFCILGSTNSIFNVTVDVGAREVTFQFLNGPVTSATCTVQYGTDPTYVNLSNNDSSTGTNVNSVTVSLSAPLQRNTVYYYVVSSIGVRMQGTFRSGMSHYLVCRKNWQQYLVCSSLRPWVII